LDLINDVLDISRIDSGALSVSLDSVPVASAMDDSLVLVAAQARDAGVAIEVSEAASSTVRADRQRLRQVLVNLLSNAIKFNRAGGAVTMRSEPDPMSSTVTISVTDTGCGIAPEMLDRIFTPYDRLGAERSGVEGTGLGLALSKRLCDAMGATIAVESALGEGCRFSITLDAAPDPDELPSDGDA
ncbi:MAG: HAMP domain-containing histidine kinase, partial [Hyphomicrobiaceae bacterium]|nr:HAMP domain-containing histidine kinase [Hyphomicrobiaceae bacterium]